MSATATKIEDKKPEQKKPEQKKPEQKKPEQKKPEQKKPEQKKPEAAAYSPSKPTAEGVQLIRKKRRQAIYLRAFFGVILPTILGIVYYGFVASNRFESTSLFNIQAVGGRQASPMDSLFGAIGAASPTSQDTLTVRDYILSRAVFLRLEEEHQFVAHYKSSKHDFLSRLNQDASLEEAYEYYKDVVQLDYDTTSGVLTLIVTAYSAEAAHEFSNAILDYSEEAVNKLSARSRKDQTLFAHKEVTLAEERLDKARQRVLKLQAERGEFSPESSATEALSVRQTLEVSLAEARAELMAARSYMAKTAPQVIALQGRVNALSVQIKKESNRLVDTKKGGLNTSMAAFESAIFQKTIAQAGYQSAVASLEMARQEASRQHRYLVRVASPSLADESTKPHRIAGIFTVLAASALLLGIGTLLSAAVREHAKI